MFPRCQLSKVTTGGLIGGERAGYPVGRHAITGPVPALSSFYRPKTAVNRRFFVYTTENVPVRDIILVMKKVEFGPF